MVFNVVFDSTVMNLGEFLAEVISVALSFFGLSSIITPKNRFYFDIAYMFGDEAAKIEISEREGVANEDELRGL
jgi:hypothetical protein